MSLQVELLEESFNLIKPSADEFVNSFYQNLFTANPEAKPLFETTDMEAQKKKLLNSLVLVVENLRQPEVLDNALRGLGARHVKYGALPEHYPLVGSALLTTFEQYLGDKWTADVKQAWVDAYGAISQIMLDGADYSQADIALPTPEAEAGLPVELLEESFNLIKPSADEFVNSFYQNLFTANPEAKPLFETTNMAEQKKKLLNSLVLVVENLRKPDVLDNALRGLGARHVKYGALPEHYPLVGSALNQPSSEPEIASTATESLTNSDLPNLNSHGAGEIAMNPDTGKVGVLALAGGGIMGIIAIILALLL